MSTLYGNKINFEKYKNLFKNNILKLTSIIFLMMLFQVNTVKITTFYLNIIGPEIAIFLYIIFSVQIYLSTIFRLKFIYRDLLKCIIKLNLLK